MYSHQLDTFLAVCKHGSFTRAAKENYITPAAVVQQINLLENQFGVKLFLRTNHGIQLTQAGEILRKESADFIRHAHDILEAMKQVSTVRPIRLGWSTGVEDSHFLSACLAFCEKHNGLEIKLSRISDGVINGMLRDEFDLCQYAQLPGLHAYGYAFTPLYTVRQCIVLPTGHPLSSLPEISLDDLGNMELVLLREGILTDHDEFRNLMRESGAPIRLIEVENYDFETRTMCYNRKLAFLGMEPLRTQYSPLPCVPAAWNVQVQIGLISKANFDVDLLIREMQEQY